MKPFKLIRLAYIEDLAKDFVPAPVHDFVLTKPTDFKNPKVSSGYGQVRHTNGVPSLYIHKANAYYTKIDGPIWYSPSLDINCLDFEKSGKEYQGYNEQILLLWLFENWSKLTNRQTISLDEIFK